MKIEIYTDGAAKGNPGRGGYGVFLRFGTNVKEISEGFRYTTNNRMELLAVIVGLESLKTNQHPITVYSDSKYVIDSITKGWVFGWVKKGFKGKKNKDLWLRYLQVHDKFKLEFEWVKGHAGHPENERCDFLAVQAAEGENLKIDTVFEQENNIH
jgi:ribonuclease HI